jgi:ABC-type sugar transport system substrate-binding protein
VSSLSEHFGQLASVTYFTLKLAITFYQEEIFSMAKRFFFAALLLLLITAFGGAVGAQDGYTIGLSNGFIGSEWRTQMIQQLEAVAAELTEAGTPIELVIESADVDVQGQIQQIQNLINRGVDAIIVNPNDIAALNSALEEAVEAGIVVISIDQEIGAQGVINVVIDQKEWAMKRVWRASKKCLLNIPALTSSGARAGAGIRRLVSR